MNNWTIAGVERVCIFDVKKPWYHLQGFPGMQAGEVSSPDQAAAVAAAAVPSSPGGDLAVAAAALPVMKSDVLQVHVAEAAPPAVAGAAAADPRRQLPAPPPVVPKQASAAAAAVDDVGHRRPHPPKSAPPQRKVEATMDVVTDVKDESLEEVAGDGWSSASWGCLGTCSWSRTCRSDDIWLSIQSLAQHSSQR